MPTEFIYPENIRTDGETQPRVKINQQACDEYGERMKAGDKFPPIDVFFDGQDYWLADGFHRLHAYALAVPGEAIECRVFQGTQADAQWHSYGVNKTHGLRRTNEDKERAVRAAMTHPNAADMSNGQISEHCGVGETTVRRYRKALDLTSPLAKSDITPASESPESRLRTGRDGRTIDTARIGRKSRRDRDKPSRQMAARIAQPTRTPNPMQKMTALNMPHNAAMGARTLIEVFDTEYLRALWDELTSYLKGISS